MENARRLVAHIEDLMCDAHAAIHDDLREYTLNELHNTAHRLVAEPFATSQQMLLSRPQTVAMMLATIHYQEMIERLKAGPSF